MTLRETVAWFIAAIGTAGTIALYARQELVPAAATEHATRQVAPAIANNEQALLTRLSEAEARVQQRDAIISRMEKEAKANAAAPSAPEPTPPSNTDAKTDAKAEAKVDAKWFRIDKSEAAHQERTRLIATFREAGFLGDIRGQSNAVSVEVTKGFMALEFSKKEAIIALIAAEWFDGTDKHAYVRLEDIRNHKDVGTYSGISAGLRME